MSRKNLNEYDVLPFQLKEMITNYQSNGLSVEHAMREPESFEYSACRFVLNKKNIVFRIAKITSKKIGQFVTVWKRPDKITMPFHSLDLIDFVIIYVADEKNKG